MMLTPWALGLTVGSAIMVWMVFRAALPAMILWKTKDPENSETLLNFQKQEILGQALFRLVWVYLALSPALLTLAAFDAAPRIPGAMCATGVFNANAFGVPFLLLRLGGVFLVTAVLALHTAGRHYPAMPFNHVLRPLAGAVFIWIVADTILQTLFFVNLNPEIATTCCAILFDESTATSTSPGLFARFPTLPLFFTASLIYMGMGIFAVILNKRNWMAAYGALSPVFFFWGIFGIISCISPYVYALPLHHCPFCMLTGKEGLLGIPLMAALYAGSLSGWGAGIKVKAMASVSLHPNPENRTWFIGSIVANWLFIGGSGLIIVLYTLFGELI